MRSALLAVAETKLHSLERHPLAPGQLRLLASVMLSRAADLEVCVCERGVCVCVCVCVYEVCVGVCVYEVCGCLRACARARARGACEGVVFIVDIYIASVVPLGVSMRVCMHAWACVAGGYVCMHAPCMWVCKCLHLYLAKMQHRTLCSVGMVFSALRTCTCTSFLYMHACNKRTRCIRTPPPRLHTHTNTHARTHAHTHTHTHTHTHHAQMAAAFAALVAQLGEISGAAGAGGGVVGHGSGGGNTRAVLLDEAMDAIVYIYTLIPPPSIAVSGSAAVQNGGKEEGGVGLGGKDTGNGSSSADGAISSLIPLAACPRLRCVDNWGKLCPRRCMLAVVSFARRFAC